jgi:hypothetical protein
LRTIAQRTKTMPSACAPHFARVLQHGVDKRIAGA